MKFFQLFCLFIISLTSACLPGPISYYEPVSIGGSLVQTHCGTAAAPKNTIEFQHRNVQIQISGYTSYLRIYVYVPQNQSAKFTSSTIQYWNNKNDNKKELRIPVIKNYDFDTNNYRQLESTSVMQYNGRKTVFGPAPELHEIIVDINEPESEHYFIQVPSLIISDEQYELPVIEFLEKDGFGVFPVNC